MSLPCFCQKKALHASPILVLWVVFVYGFSLSTLPVVAQNEMQAISYNLSNVLPTDLIKASVQDKRGFVWAASDAGVVRFDGRHSTLHKNLPSPYVKGCTPSKAKS
jgi:ligand-binding sensor domain-containing protein